MQGNRRSRHIPVNRVREGLGPCPNEVDQLEITRYTVADQPLVGTIGVVSHSAMVRTTSPEGQVTFVVGGAGGAGGVMTGGVQSAVPAAFTVLVRVPKLGSSQDAVTSRLLPFCITVPLAGVKLTVPGVVCVTLSVYVAVPLRALHTMLAVKSTSVGSGFGAGVKLQVTVL